LPLFHGSRRTEIAVGANMLNSYCLKGSPKPEIHPSDGISTGRQIFVVDLTVTLYGVSAKRSSMTHGRRWEMTAI
jgi:hypothetical protein